MQGSIGSQAESLARRYLEQRGLRFVAANYRTRRGEIDLVMTDGTILVFVEVRFRRNGRFGSAVESVDRHKRQRVIAAASGFIQSHGKYRDRQCRFDVVGVTDGQIEWIDNAFTADG